MNLAFRDIRHKLGRFILTCLGLSLLLGVVVTMAGIYRGQTADALALVRSIGADIWVVQTGTYGPFAESSRIPGDTRELVARIYGVVSAGSITLQNVQVERDGKKLRLQVIGYEPGRPGGPIALATGREITRSHYELIADRQTGLKLGDTIELARHSYTVVGLTTGNVTLSGDAIMYVTLRDAQQIQFDLAPPLARRQAARGAQRAETDLVNAIVARVSPHVPVEAIATEMRRWKHLAVMTEAEQETILTRTVVERAIRQLGMFMGILTIVSAVIIALIIYTLTMDKLREIATLKLIGASSWTLVNLIVQQALLLGISGFAGGVVLVYAFHDRFPRRIEMLPGDIAALGLIVVLVCLLASALGVRVAVKVDPAQALAG
jgi:putative ABC transport system permease protein